MRPVELAAALTAACSTMEDREFAILNESHEEIARFAQVCRLEGMFRIEANGTDWEGVCHRLPVEELWLLDLGYTHPATKAEAGWPNFFALVPLDEPQTAARMLTAALIVLDVNLDQLDIQFSSFDS